MKLVITGQELYKGISAVAPAAKKSIANPILQNILVKALPKDCQPWQATVSATDLSMALQAALEVNASECVEGSALLPAEVLMKTAAKLQHADSVTLEAVKKSRQVKITAPGFSASVTRMESADYPPWPSMPEKEDPLELRLSGSDIDEIATKLAWCCSEEKSRFELGGIKFDVEAGRLICAATDGRRLATRDFDLRVDDDNEPNSGSAILPLKTTLALKSFFEDQALTMEIASRKARITGKTREAVTSLLADTFPVWRRIVPAEEALSNAITVDRVEMVEAIERAAIYCSEETKVLIVRASGSSVSLEGENADAGRDGVALVNAETNEPIEARFNWQFLLQAVRSMYSERVVMKFAGGNGSKPMVISGEGDPGWHYVLMPMRPPESEEKEKAA